MTQFRFAFISDKDDEDAVEPGFPPVDREWPLELDYRPAELNLPKEAALGRPAW